MLIQGFGTSNSKAPLKKRVPKKNSPVRGCRMAPKFKLVLFIALTVIVADHLTKWMIVESLPIGAEIPVWRGFFDIVHTRNTGAAFGMLSSWNSPLRDWFFYGIGILAFAFLYYYVKTTPASDRVSLTALSLITGGAIGNLTDRMMRGSVVDFLSVHWREAVWRFSALGRDFVIPLIWPAFNVADAAICVGVGLLLVRSLRAPEPQN